ncbi:MAG: SpoIID/LytB domain-containing protein [Lachnospiraceae bacterium]|nr:SpoIID/LytB domain-containing protein [Lachnospiraceae bacterium]
MKEAEERQLPFDENVRILIMNQRYRGIYHTELHIACSDGMLVDDNGTVSECAPDSEYALSSNDFKAGSIIRFEGKNNGKLQIRNLERNGLAQYRGRLECYAAGEGIVVVNELPVEEYLYGVVPSEMPPSYPEEALKAQAVCARTYTYYHKQKYAYPEWQAHMNDSTAFQVYGNCDESPDANRAVDETRNQVLTYKDKIVESFYYSTSGGYNGGAGVWRNTVSEEDSYLVETGMELYAANSEEGELAYQQYIDNGNTEDVEYGEAWYRWNYDKVFDASAVKMMFQKIYNLSLSQPHMVRIRSRFLSSDKILEEETIKDIRVLGRRKSGLVTGIMIDTEHFRVSIMSQNAIRHALGCDRDVIYRKDGSSYTMGDILPSAYFYIEKSFDNNGESGDNLKQITIHGAGFGHGCGMSQNGAKALADKGLTADRILAYYYNGSIKAVSELDWTAR